MTPDLTIGLLTWRSRDMLDACIRSIFAGAERVSFEVLVVDNASGDGTLEMLAEKYPQVRVIENAENVGVAPARNQLLDDAKGRYLAFLDVDTLVKPGSLSTVIEVMEARPDVAIGAPKLVYRDGTLQHSCRRFPGLLNVIVEGTFLRRHFPNSRLVKEVTMEDWDHKTMREVECVYGACMVVRMSDVPAIGRFDEAYRYMYEDYDYCFKAHRIGKKVLYIPQAEIVHFLEREGKSVFHKMIGRHVRSLFRYLSRDYYPHIWLRRKRFAGGRPQALSAEEQV